MPAALGETNAILGIDTPVSASMSLNQESTTHPNMQLNSKVPSMPTQINNPSPCFNLTDDHMDIIYVELDDIDEARPGANDEPTANDASQDHVGSLKDSVDLVSVSLPVDVELPGEWETRVDADENYVPSEEWSALAQWVFDLMTEGSVDLKGMSMATLWQAVLPVVKAQKRSSSHRCEWSDEQDRHLVLLTESRVNWELLVMLFGRTKNAIVTRLRGFGYSVRTKPRRRGRRRRQSRKRFLW